MKYNFLMERILTRVYRNGIEPFSSCQIWKQKTIDGDDFFGIGNFCGMSTENVIEYGKELTELEWKGNELFFTAHKPELLEKNVIAAYLALKKQMEDKFPDTIFDLVVSIDENNGTGNIRLYKIREGYHFIEATHKNLSEFKQEAILVDTVNSIYLKKYITILSEKMKEYPVKIYLTKEKEIKIQNCFHDEHIYIAWDEEFTMYFGDFHAHYDEDEWEDLLQTIDKILSGVLVTVRVGICDRWLCSFICAPEEIPVTSKSKLLNFLFNGQKDFREEIQYHGAVVSITGWKQQNTKTYLITEKGIEQE